MGTFTENQNGNKSKILVTQSPKPYFL